MRTNRTRKLSWRVCYALAAGLAGAFLIPQMASAAPMGEHDMTAGVNVGRPNAVTTSITGTTLNNVIKWNDYSVKAGETVNYDGRNYLNIVTGGSSSAINGTINNSGGDIYLVNPNGVLMGKTASVNVGNLYVSTQETSTVGAGAFETSGTAPLSTTAVGKADVVNMGSVSANKVEVYGKNIRILDAGTVSAATRPVILHTDAANDGYAHIGYQTATPPAASAYTVNGTAATAADNYYKLVHNTTEFQNISSNLAGNYMLANDIDFTDPVTLAPKAVTPLGGNGAAPFTGKIDGNFYKVKNYTVLSAGGWTENGLFGRASGARFDNIGIKGVNIALPTSLMHYGGALVGYTTGNTVLRGVSVTDSTVTGRPGYAGGIIGGADHTTVSESYSKVTTNSGGILGGAFGNGTVFNDVYGDVTATPSANVAGLAYFIQNPSVFAPGFIVNRAYSTAAPFVSSSTAPPINDTYTINKSTGEATLYGLTTPPPAANAKTSATYTNWNINNDGAPGAKWRVYEGRTLPMLTAFMDGTATATYNYRYFKADGTPSAAAGNTVKTNGTLVGGNIVPHSGADISPEYNSYYLKIVDKNTPNAVGGVSNVTFSGNVDPAKVKGYVSGQDLNTTDGIRNKGTKAILWTDDQEGPNLRGVNVTVKPREVRLDNGTINPNRMYNGKSDVTDAFIAALTSGSVTSSGFTAEDIAAGTVSLDFTTGGFKAQMVYNPALAATGANLDKNVGTNKPVKFSGSIGFTGPDAVNYTFDNTSLSNLTGSATITKAPVYLHINKYKADDKIYNGESNVLDAAMKQTGATPNVTLDKTYTAPPSSAASPVHHDGEIMRNDNNAVDDIDLTSVTDPKYTDTSGNEQIHVGSHKLEYTNVGLTGADAGNYELFYKLPLSGTKTAVTNSKLYLDGDIVRREITRDSFKVYNRVTGLEVSAEKVYDGNVFYTPDPNTYLSVNAPASSTTGIVARDHGHITFALTGGRGRFQDGSGNDTKNVAEATKLAYNVHGVADTHTDAYGGHELSDYYVLGADGVTKHSLSSAFDATGDGKITPKVLTATVVNSNITKVYDAMREQTDGNRHIIKGDPLVTLSGFVTGESRTNTSTAMYATKNVVLDAFGSPTTQAVDYTASFVRPAGAESDNYTLDPTGTTVSNSAAIAGSYTGVITPRSLTMTFTPVTKIYDGTDTNTDKELATLNDGAGGAVVTADGITTTNFNMTGVTSRYGSGTGASFASNVNAGSRTVEYTGLAGTLSDNNYKIVDTQYGTGTITRRRIDPTGFQVRKSDGTVANATKVYDGNDRYTLPSGAYLTTPVAPSPTTGLVTRDYGKITFDLKSGSAGHFASDPDGNNLTSHVSEAQYVAYDVIARTSNGTTNPLSNYTFGSAAAEAAGTLKNLENITNANPAHVTASGTITPANLTAATHNITKVYDAMAEHTDGSRNIVKGDSVVTFTGWQTNDAGQQEKRTNTSTAAYASKNVAYDPSHNITTQTVNYTAQLSGQYADDYQIVDAANTVISSAAGTGAGTTVTLNAPLTVANAGTITPRALKIKMADVSKTYDGDTRNTSATVAEITDTVNSSVIGAILGDDNVTASRLTAQYNTQMSASPGNYHSDYGRLAGTTFTPNPNASNGVQHDVQYTNMKNAFGTEFGTPTAGNYTVDTDAYGKGTINRRDLNPDDFHVVDAFGTVANATKEYDGTDVYNVPAGWSIVPSGGPGTGVVAGDNVMFSLTSGGAKFTTAAKNPTANAFEAAKVMYNVAASGDPIKIKNYTLGGQKLEEGRGKVYGDGTITRRTIDLALVQNTGIDKVYDGQTGLIDTASKHWNALTKTDARGNVKYAAGSKELVNDGSSFHIESNYRNSANTANDKNVAKSAGTVIDKDIQYDIHISGGDARNYAFANGGTPINAENGLKLSATGKITPKDLSNAFTKITKVYDGTTNVDPTAVGFTSGAVLSGDSVSLAGHAEAFQSPNVRGDGTTTVIDGAVQKNWINYSGLSLGGADADNYTISATAKGLGEITPLQLNPSTVTLLTTGPATKVYDGTRTVKWTNGSAAVNDVKNYITDAQVTVGGNTLSVLGDVSLQSAEYDTKNVAGGASVGRVTYHMRYTGTSGNFALAPGASTFDALGDGTITPKDVKAAIQGPMTKVYDGTTDVIGAARNSLGTIRTANDMVSLTGLIAGDGATNQSTASYDDKNVGAGSKSITYDVKIDPMNAGNYRLVDAMGAAITAPITTTNNTITARRVNVTFGNVSKSFDGTSTNTTIDPSVSAADAAVLNRDSAGLVNGSNKLTNLGGIVSNYGRRTGGTFTPDANAGTNKDVQYAGLAAAMGTTLGSDAANYVFDTDGYGKGSIGKAIINASDVTFTAGNASKVYDGTRAVKYNGSAASNDVKNYITTIGVMLNGNWVDLSSDVVMDLGGTRYSSPNATNGTPDTVTYKFHLNNNNITVNGTNDFTKDAQGTIDRRVLNVGLAQNSGIDKIYDGNAKLIDTASRHYDKFVDDDARGNVVYAAGTTNDNKLVRTSNGAAVNDGAKMTITANYVDNLTNRTADKNVVRDGGGNVTAKDIAYNVKIDAANGGRNYQLSDGMTTANAEDGLNMDAAGTISPRKITLGFANVSKPYDTTAVNNTKNITSVTAGNSDGRGAAALAADGITSASFNTAGVQSFYGAGNTDGTFVQNPNVVTDANGNVITNGKDVQYSNLANTLAAQPYAGNYEVADTAYGKGTIRKRTVTANDFSFSIDPARKMYDGTRDVVWTDPVTRKSYKDMAHVKKHFQTSTLDLGGGNTVPINLDDISLNSAQYNDANVALANSVDYNVTINTTNFDFSGTRNKNIHHTGDTITRRDLATLLPQHLIKEYDGTATFDQTNRDFVNAMAREHLEGIVAADRNKGIVLNVTGTYNSPNASAETKADAEARTSATAGRTVTYSLTLSGPAAATANYTIGTSPTTLAADIYKKTLSVDVARKEKDYDGTAAVTGLTAGDIVFGGVAAGDTLALDSTALSLVNGKYLDAAGNADPTVSRDANRNVADKAVSYTGLDAALADLATRNTTAANYRVDGGTKNYTAAAGKGRINPLTITPGNINTIFDTAGARKIYDGTRAVKYNGKNTADALRNYLTSATVQVGSQTVNIKDDLAIDPNASHYDNKNAGTGKTVTYGLKYTGNNFNITDFTKDDVGEITPKDVRVAGLGQLVKTYDGTSYVYDAAHPETVTKRHGTQVTDGDSVVELENGGLIVGDDVQNASTAEYADKNAGTGKTVIYNPQLTGADAANYRLVDVLGNAIPAGGLTTTDNTIKKRLLDITFDRASKTYDTTSTNNTHVTARVDAAAGRTLLNDGVGVINGRITTLTTTNVDSDYGYNSTDATFRADANAGEKDVQYRNVGAALRSQLGTNAGNYDFKENYYGKGSIDKANVTAANFDLHFGLAKKEYDGTTAVDNPRGNLLPASTVTIGGVARTLPDENVASVTGTYRDKNAGNPRVDYRVKIDNRNFNLGSWDGIVDKDGAGQITKRRLIADPSNYLTKEYDGTSDIIGKARNGHGDLITAGGDNLVKFHHYSGTPTNPDGGLDTVFRNDGDVSNDTTAVYDDPNVKWQGGVWNQGNGTIDDKTVNYSLAISGTGANNYEIVDANGNAVNLANPYVGKGKITPKDIVLKADPQSRWINEGLPSSYTGTPSGSNLGHSDIPAVLQGEVLPGTIDYDAPNARLRVGDYAINGTYHAPGGTDGDAVSRNYRFVQDPANATALHVGPYIPDYEYYKAMTQVSKMTPDEYAYENASLDRTNHYSRKPTAQVNSVPPSVNVMKDGKDITRSDINVLDDTVYTIVDDVFS